MDERDIFEKLVLRFNIKSKKYKNRSKEFILGSMVRDILDAGEDPIKFGNKLIKIEYMDKKGSIYPQFITLNR